MASKRNLKCIKTWTKTHPNYYNIQLKQNLVIKLYIMSDYETGVLTSKMRGLVIKLVAF